MAEEIDPDKALQAQKMQAISQLAGGVAHDFNNLLTAMLGYCDLLLERHKPGDPSFADIVQLKQNANRAINLVRQLLAVSRQQPMKAERLDLREVVLALSELVRRLMGEKIKVETSLPTDPVYVVADKGQLEQVIINLAVNARDAMMEAGEGGTLSLHLQAGTDAQLTVRDTGGGIPADVKEKIFEPFFTTKAQGKGTGLGLATVLGIVEQSGGRIDLESDHGGTQFHIHLPFAEKGATEVPVPEPLPVADAGPVTILLVEDERAVRRLAERALQGAGHSVTAAADAEEALEIIAEGECKPDVLVTDVVMPGMDGPALYGELLKAQGDLKALFMSGYAEEELREQIGAHVESGRARFIAKPFTLNALKSALGHVLAR